MRVEIKSIICTTDFSDFSYNAIPYGIALAKEFGAKLYVCHVIDLSSAAMYGEIIADTVEQQNRIMGYTLEHLKRIIGEQPVDWEPLITVGHTADEIASVAEEKNVHLVISATHGRSGLKRLILGSVTQRLMRTLPCPLLLVRGPESDFVASENHEIRLKKILVGCDFSPDSDLAFQFGLSLAQEFQAELHLAHVIAPPVYKDLLKRSIKSEEKYQEDLREKLNEEITNMVPDEARIWCTPQTTLLAGQPQEELMKYAVVNRIDLIVLGVRGHSLIEKWFVGSTTDLLARQAPCPVLSVQPTVQSL